MIEQVSENPKPLSPDVQTVPFQCNVCGECCSSFNIPMEAEKAQYLLGREWARKRLAEKRRELVKVTKTLYRIPLTDENTCVFLAGDNRCLIEVHEGRDAKPSECRNFPFAAVKMPDGETAYDTSASCKTVAEKLLLAFKPIVPQPGEAPNLEESPFPGKIPVHALFKISTAEYEDYLARLRGIFHHPDFSAEEALRASWRLARRLPKSLREPAGQDLSPVSGKPGRWDFWRIFFLRKPYGAYSWTSLLGGPTYADPRIFGDPVSLRGLAGVSLPGEVQPVLKAFLWNLLQRRVVLTHGHSLWGMLAMAGVAYALVVWYARVLASLTGRKVVESTDVWMAIRLCERYYTGHQPRFLGWFARMHQGAGLAMLMYCR